MEEYGTCEMTGKEIIEYLEPKNSIGHVRYTYGHWHGDMSVCMTEETYAERKYSYIPRTWAGIVGADDDPITITETIIHHPEDYVPF